MNDFDKRFNRTHNFIMGYFVVIGALAIATVGGVGYVAYKVLSHFGVLA